MNGRIPASVLLSCGSAIEAFPLPAVAETLAGWGRPIPKHLAIPVSLSEARRTLRSMPVEQAAAVAAHARCGEETYRLLRKDRRATVRRSLAVNREVPKSLRAEWLAEQVGDDWTFDVHDSDTAALVAGTMMDGPPEGRLRELLEGLGSGGWQLILQNIPGDLIWPSIRDAGYDPIRQARLLVASAELMAAEGRPSTAEVSALLSAAFETHEKEGGVDSLFVSGRVVPEWLGAMLTRALASTPDHLAGHAYNAINALTRMRHARDSRWLQPGVQEKLMERILMKYNAGEGALPSSTHHSHLVAAAVALARSGETLHFDDSILDAATSGMPAFGHTLNRLGGLINIAASIRLDRLDHSEWEKRAVQLSGRKIGARSESRWIGGASLAVALSEGTDSLAELPEGLVKICAEHSGEGPSLQRILEAGGEAAELLKARISQVRSSVGISEDVLCGLVATGALRCEDVIAQLSSRSLVYIQHGFEAPEGVSVFSERWQEMGEMASDEGAAGIARALRSTAPERRLELMAAIGTGSDTRMWAAAAPSIADTVREALASDMDGDAADRWMSEAGRAGAALSAAAIVLLLEDGRIPEEMTLEGRIAGKLPDRVQTQYGRALAGRLAELHGADTEQAREASLQLAACMTVHGLAELHQNGYPAETLLRGMLGEEVETWRLFAALSESWKGSVKMLAEAVQQLAAQRNGA